MATLHLLAKRVWGDFDMPYDTPLLASENEGLLKEKAAELNNKRPQSDLAYGEWRVEYLVMPGTVSTL